MLEEEQRIGITRVREGSGLSKPSDKKGSIKRTLY